MFPAGRRWGSGSGRKGWSSAPGEKTPAQVEKTPKKVRIDVALSTRKQPEWYLVKDEAELIGPQRPLWWVGLVVDQTRSQTGHGAVVDHGAVLESREEGSLMRRRDEAGRK